MSDSASSWIWRLANLLGKMSKGPVRRLEQLRYPIKDLLLLCGGSGILVIEAVDSCEFIQFRKETMHKAEGLVMNIPLASWSEPYFDQIVIIIGELKGVKVAERFIETPPSIEVYFSEDVDLAFSTTKRILTEAFKFNEEARFYALLD